MLDDVRLFAANERCKALEAALQSLVDLSIKKLATILRGCDEDDDGDIQRHAIAQLRAEVKTRRNEKAFAIVDTELLQTILETIEIMSDPEAFGMLQSSLKDIRAGRLHDYEDVKSELLWPKLPEMRNADLA